MKVPTLRRLVGAYTAELPAAVAAAYPTALFSASFLLVVWLRLAGVL